MTPQAIASPHHDRPRQRVPAVARIGDEAAGARLDAGPRIVGDLEGFDSMQPHPSGSPRHPTRIPRLAVRVAIRVDGWLGPRRRFDCEMTRCRRLSPVWPPEERLQPIIIQLLEHHAGIVGVRSRSFPTDRSWRLKGLPRRWSLGPTVERLVRDGSTVRRDNRQTELHPGQSARYDGRGPGQIPCDSDFEPGPAQGRPASGGSRFRKSFPRRPSARLWASDV
jgi:hypothetical protein